MLQLSNKRILAGLAVAVLAVLPFAGTAAQAAGPQAQKEDAARKT